MSLTTPPTVEKLKEALHAKAKVEPEFRFYRLYDKLYRPDVLEFAYNRCKANRGAAGADGQTFTDIEAYGLHKWLGELTQELRNRTYRPGPVLRVWIPKPDGSKRPLGIPAIRDRVVQTAAVTVLEPIFEADLQPEQHGYRPGRSAHDALKEVRTLLTDGHTEVVDADLSGYFDTIPHGDLMQSVARRLCDRHVLHLIKMWLTAPVEERDARGRVRRTTRNKDEHRGCPQGAPISPLLSNIYMRRFVLGFKTLGHERRLDAHIVNYADDLVLCCNGTAEQAMTVTREMMSRLKLTVNEKKTRVCRVPEETFHFLGYTIGRCYLPTTGKSLIGMWPSKKSVSRVVRKLSELTEQRRTWKPVDEVVETMNRTIAGWIGYFRPGFVSKAWRAVERHAQNRLRRWLCRKHAVPAGSAYVEFPDAHLHKQPGLMRLRKKLKADPPCAQA